MKYKCHITTYPLVTNCSHCGVPQLHYGIHTRVTTCANMPSPAWLPYSTIMYYVLALTKIVYIICTYIQRVCIWVSFCFYRYKWHVHVHVRTAVKWWWGEVVCGHQLAHTWVLWEEQSSSLLQLPAGRRYAPGISNRHCACIIFLLWQFCTEFKALSFLHIILYP